VSPDKLPRVTETVSTPVSTVDNLQERFFEPNSISHKKLLTESLLRRNIELLTRQNEQASLKVYDVRRTDDNGRRTPSDGKSSHDLWPGELKMVSHTAMSIF
jgi:hypothetical protein